MRGFPVFVLHLASITAVAALCTSLEAQTPSKPVDPQSFSVSVAMKQPETPLGQATWLIVSVKILVENAHYADEFLPHVEGKEGEVPRTMYHRQLRHEPGLPELRPDCMSCFNDLLKPSDTHIRSLDLTKYYDLSIPGKYSVYVEYPDEKGKWQRTNTVQFTVQATAR